MEMDIILLLIAGVSGILLLIVGTFIILSRQILGPNRELQDRISKLEKELHAIDHKNDHGP